MRGPKVVLIGAGSAFFGRSTVWSMVRKPALSTGTLALCDVDATLLKTMEQVARRAIEAADVPLTLEVSTDYRKLLKGADFVILAFAVEGVRLRGVDARLSTKHGVVMCSADTIGPGGILRTCREVPRQQRILNDIERVCPDAWVVNWVNPTAAMGLAMMRLNPTVKSLAICDGPHNPHFDVARLVEAGLIRKPEQATPELLRNTRIRSGGVNHFNWLTDISYRGRDLMGNVRKHYEKQLRTAKNKGMREHWGMILDLADAYGAFPMCFGHTREYVPWFQGLGKKKTFTIAMWRIQNRWKWMRGQWRDMRDIASGRRSIGDFLEKPSPDHASDIIESMWAGLGTQFYINTPNRGAITNMPDDAFVEVLCDVSLDAVRPLPYGPMPRPLLSMFHTVLDEHELAVEAGATCDRDTLKKAFVASPVTTNLADIDAMIGDLLKAERPYLPKAWYAKRSARRRRKR